MRFVGLDVHKRVVQACVLNDDGSQSSMLRFSLSAASLLEFAKYQLGKDCAVALEATTNTGAIVAVLEPYCQRVVVSNPMRRRARIAPWLHGAAL